MISTGESNLISAMSPADPSSSHRSTYGPTSGLINTWPLFDSECVADTVSVGVEKLIVSVSSKSYAPSGPFAMKAQLDGAE